jgi:hypothetical protein
LTGPYTLVYLGDMNTTTAQVTEIRFTAKRACVWSAGNGRWVTIGREKAQALIALGAVELKDGEWV